MQTKKEIRKSARKYIDSIYDQIIIHLEIGQQFLKSLAQPFPIGKLHMRAAFSKNKVDYLEIDVILNVNTTCSAPGHFLFARTPER